MSKQMNVGDKVFIYYNGVQKKRIMRIDTAQFYNPPPYKEEKSVDYTFKFIDKASGMEVTRILDKSVVFVTKRDCEIWAMSTRPEN